MCFDRAQGGQHRRCYAGINDGCRHGAALVGQQDDVAQLAAFAPVPDEALRYDGLVFGLIMPQIGLYGAVPVDLVGLGASVANGLVDTALNGLAEGRRQSFFDGLGYFAHYLSGGFAGMGRHGFVEREQHGGEVDVGFHALQ